MIFIYIILLLCCSKDDAAFKQKQREDKKKLAEAQARASQKGPMGNSLDYIYNLSTFIIIIIISRW